VAKGSGFESAVDVYLDDGVRFAAGSKVKRGVKCVQKGGLATGQTLAEYAATRGGEVLLIFRNVVSGGETPFKVSFAASSVRGAIRRSA